jgi:hypothetical protein
MKDRCLATRQIAEVRLDFVTWNYYLNTGDIQILISELRACLPYVLVSIIWHIKRIAISVARNHKKSTCGSFPIVSLTRLVIGRDLACQLELLSILVYLVIFRSRTLFSTWFLGIIGNGWLCIHMIHMRPSLCLIPREKVLVLWNTGLSPHIYVLGAIKTTEI